MLCENVLHFSLKRKDLGILARFFSGFILAVTLVFGAVGDANAIAVTCSAGQYCYYNGRTARCTACTAGYYCPGGNLNCGASNTIVGRNACSALTPAPGVTGGTYTSAASSSAATACKYTAPAVTQSPEACNATPTPIQVTWTGSAWPTKLYNATAKAGAYVSSAIGNNCAYCPFGSYTASAGTQTSCTPCQNGTTTSSTGQTSCNADCINKNDYTYGWNTVTWNSLTNSVVGVCSPSGCIKGAYARQINNNQCAPCAAGTYQATANSLTTSCTNLPAGYYNTGCGTSSTGGVCSVTDGGLGLYKGSRVNPGYYSTGGGTSATPTANGAGNGSNGCRSGYNCGKVNAEYFSTGGGTSATPVQTNNGCITGQSCGACAEHASSVAGSAYCTCDNGYVIGGGTNTATYSTTDRWGNTCAARQYTITYKTGNTVIGTQTCNYGDTVTPLTESQLTNVPSALTTAANGWGFKGWASTYNTTSASTANFTCSGNMTKYGVWSRKFQITWYVAANSTSATTDWSPEQDYINTTTTGASVKGVVSPSLYTITSYDTQWAPVGWALNDTSANATVNEVQTSDDPTKLQPEVNVANPHYYALYERTPYIRYSVESGSGSVANTACSVQRYNSASTSSVSTSTCTLSSTVPTGPNSSYSFSKWSVAHVGEYSSGASISYPPNWYDVILNDAYAIYSTTITLNKNGGSGTIQGTSGTGNASITCNYGSSCSFGSAAGLSQTGYTFKGGWGTSASCTATTTSFTNPTGTYYACKTANTYTISYALNGGTSGSSAPTTATYNTEFTVDNPTRTGYTFNGWTVSGMDSTTHYYGASSANTSSTATSWTNSTITSSIKKFKNLRSTAGTVTFTANWTANDYTITFKSGDTVLGTQSCTYGTTVTLNSISTMSNIPVSSDYGWSFDGWATVGSNIPTVVYQDSASTYSCTGDAILRGVWSRNVAFKYYADATATTVTTSNKTQYYRDDQWGVADASYVANDYLLYTSTQSGSGWEPVGWSTSSYAMNAEGELYDGTHTIWVNFPIVGGGVNGIVYSAIYKRKPVIAYNGNTNTGGSTANTECTDYQYYNASGSVSSASSCTLATNGFTKTGYTFNKWAAGSASGTQYAAGASYTYPNTTWTSANTYTMYATWTQCTACAATGGATCSLSVVNNTCTYTTSCPSAVTSAGYSIVNNGAYNPYCRTQCSAGNAVLTANAACAVVTGNRYQTGNHYVTYGNTTPTASDTASPSVGKVYSCPTNYTISGTAATDHDARSDCQRSITLNKNGGSGSVSTSVTCSAGVACTLPDASGLTQTGYTFGGGWSTSSGAGATGCTNSVNTPSAGTYYACKTANNYTLTVVAGNGVKLIQGDSNWTNNANLTQSTRTLSYGFQFSLDELTMDLKPGYQGYTYTVTSGNATVASDGKVTMGAGDSTITINAATLMSPKNMGVTPSITGGTTKTYNYQATTLTASYSPTNAYDSGVHMEYKFGYTPTSTSTTCSGTVTYGNQTETATLSVAKDAFLGYRCYKILMYATDGILTSEGSESGWTTMGLIQNAITFNATQNSGTLSGTSPLYQRYNDANLYTTATGTTTATVPTASKTGNNVWTGWYTAASGGSQIYNASNTLSSATVSGWISGSKWVATGAKTLYAQYGACGCTKGSNVSECTVTGVSNNKCQYSYTCNSGYHVGSSGTTATGTFEGVVGTATNTSPACSVNSYTITVKAGAGVSTVAATGWTNTGTASMSKSFNYGSTINLPNTVTPTRKNGYTGTSYAVTSGNCTINASNVVTVGAGACEITVNATGITAPTAVTISGGTTQIYNYQAVPLTTSVTTPTYDSGISVNYQFEYTSYSNSTCGTSYTNVGTASTTSTYSVPKNAYRNYRCYNVKVSASGEGGLTSGSIEAETATVVRFIRKGITFDPNGGTLVPETPNVLYPTYDTNTVYTSNNNNTTGTIPTASKPGCAFNGWWTAGGNQVLNANNQLTSATISGYIANSVWRNTGAKTVYAQFNCMNVSAPDKTLTYNGSAQSCANVTVTSPSGATVAYSTSENGTYSGTAPTITNVSQSPITVYYKVSATGYTDMMGSYTCTMNKANCPITVKEGSTTLGTSSVVTLTYPTTKSLTATSSCGNAVTLSSGNTSYVTVNGTTLSPVAVTSSNVTMTATVAESSNYNAASTTFLAKVNRGSCTITLTPTSGTITYPNTTSTFNINWGNCNGTKTATSSDTDKATVALNSGNGSATVTFVNAGSATITVKSAQSAQYAQSTATYTATLVNGTPTITLKDGTTNVNAGSGSTAYNGTKTLTATCSNSATPTVSSGTTSVATANISNGTITLTPVATGTSRITVTCPATGHWDAVSTYYDWTVSNGTITATVINPSKTYDGTALSCNGISNVSPSGATVEYAVKSGNTCGTYSTTVPSSITNVADSKTICYRISKTNYTTKSGEYTCTVSKADCTLGFNETSGNTPYGTNKTFTVTSNPSGGTLTVSPTATGTGINATASISGTTVTMTPRAVGNQTITVTSAATSNYNSCSKNYTLTVNKGNCTVNLSATSGTITYPTANTTFTASSTSGGTLTVSPTATGSGIHAIAAISNGTVTVTPQSAGTQVITVTSAATTNYNACSATYTATVNAKTITLKKNNGSGTCGGVTGTADGSMTCTYGGTCAAPSWNSSTCNITNGVKIFDGWATSASGAVAYAPNADLTNAPTTLYAHWTTPTCNVTNGTGTAASTTTNTPKCTVTCNTGYHTSGTYTGTQNATSYSYTCEISSYTVTVKAGNGISTVAATGWTNTGTAQMNKSYNYNSTIDLSSVVTPTRKNGYTGTAYAVTSGNCTISGSTVTVGAGACEITVNATGITAPTAVTISGGTTQTFNYQAVPLTTSVTTPTYDSGISLMYQFEYTGYSNSTCDALYTTYGDASTTSTYSVASNVYKGYRCYNVKVYASGEGLTSSTIEATTPTVVRFVQRNVNFVVDPENGETISTGTTPTTLFSGYNTNKLYTTKHGSTQATIPTASKPGCKFNGWWTATSGGNQVLSASNVLTSATISGYTASSTWRNTSNKNVYAQFNCMNVTEPTNTALTYNGTSTTNGTAQNCAGVTLTNAPSGATVTYSTTETGTYTSTTPTLTTVAQSPVTVYYKVSASGYTTLTGSYTCTMNAATPVYTKTNKTKVYDGTALSCNGVSFSGSGNKPTDGTIKYSTSQNGTYSTTVPQITNVGSQTIWFKVSGTNFTESAADSFTCSVTPAACGVTLSATSGSTTYPNTKTFTASTASGCTLSVSPTATGTGINATASISNGTVTMTPRAVGTQTITVTATPDGNHTESSATYTLTVNNGTIACEDTAAGCGNKSWTYDTSSHSCAIAASAVTPSGATIKYRTATSGDYTLTTAPSVTNVADSKTVYYQITAANYTTKTGSFTCNISKAACGVSLGGTSGSTTYPTVKSTTVSTASGCTLSAATSSSSVATAAISGGNLNMTPAGAGTATITVTATPDNNHTQSTGTYTLTVNRGSCTITLTPTSGTITYPTTTTSAFNINWGTCNGTKSISSSNTGKATAVLNSGNGSATVTFVDNGSATITVKSAQTDQYNQATANYTVTLNRETITLNWDENGGGALTNGSCSYGGDLTLPAAPTRAGYTFLGWKTAANETAGNYRAAGATITGGCTSAYTGVTSGTSTAIQAQWQANDYTITFKTGNTIMGTQNCTYGTTVTLNALSTMTGVPVSDAYGWVFSGWADDFNVSMHYADAATTYSCEGDATLYGVWTRTVRRHRSSNGGSNGVGQLYYNTTASTADVSGVELFTLTTNATYGWEPYGWAIQSITSTEAAVTTTSGAAAPVVYPAINVGQEDGVHYYALWKRKPTISYDGNTNTGGSTASTECAYQYFNMGCGNSSSSNCGTSASCTLASNGFSKTGYTFSKWRTGASSGTQYAAGASYTFPNIAWNSSQSSTMYATWNANTYTVNYALNGGNTLPQGYERLEYIEGTGTQYIDTGINAVSASSYGAELKYVYPSAQSGRSLIGAWEDASHSAFGQPYTQSDTTSALFIGKPNAKTNVFAYTAGTIITDSFSVNVSGGSVERTFNGTTSTASSLDFSSPTTLTCYLFAVHRSNGANQISSARMYYAKLYKDNVLVFNGIPAKNSSNVIGMYDTVSGQFFTNAGTGDFVAGPAFTNSTTETYDVNFVVPNPTHPHGTFAGWNITGMESGVTHTLGSTTNTATSASNITATNFKNLRATSGTVTYTATWTCDTGYSGADCSASTYNVTYSCGNGSGTAPTTPNSATYDAGFTPAANTCTKTGYHFTGWLVSGTSDVKDAGTEFTWQYTENKTLTAQWAANTNTAYKVYHYTKNTSGSNYTQNGSVDNLTGTSDASVTLSTLTRNITGFTYDKGFAGTAAAGTTMPAANTAVTTTTILPDGTRVISLYYNRNGYTITLNKNGGSGKVGSDTTVNSNPATITCTYGDTVTLPAYSSTTQLTKGTGATSAVFRGWADNNDCTATTCAYTGVECTGDKTVYAVWIVPTCAAGTGVGATSLNSVSGNAPVCNKTASNGNYCTSATQTGTAGATSLTVTCTACPAVDSGYSYVSGTGWTSYSQCKETKGGANCASGALTKTATSASAWGDAVSTLTAPAGSYVNGESCNLCATGSYTATAGTQTSCTVCGNGTTTNGTGQTSCNAICVNNNNYDHAWATPTWNNNNPTGVCEVTSCKKGSYFVGLPDGYTQLEYIESTGTQYIDTGIYPTNTTAVETKFKNTYQTSTTSVLVGDGWSSPKYLLSIVASTNAPNRIGGAYNTLANFWTVGTEFTVSMNAVNGLSVNGTRYPWTSGSVGTFTGTTTLKAFADGSTTNRFAKVKMYYLRMYNNGSLVRNFIPAKRNSDGVLGMYDTVNGVFYTNAGTGDFVAGPALQGKNLFDYSIGLQYASNPTVVWTVTHADVTFALNQATGLYTVSGTSTGTGGRNTLRTQTFSLPAGTYTISATNNPAINILLVNETTGNTIAQTQSTTTFTLTETTPLHFGLSRTLGTTYDDEFYLQIEQGSTATDYQPYGVSYANSCEECVGATYQATDGSVATACTACAAGYDYNTDNGKTAASLCQTNCAGGSTVITANQTCTNVGTGYWSAGGIVSYGDTGTRTACPTGMTTTGSGTGADEAGDCGRILHVGSYSMRLRSVKKTSPSMMFDMNGDNQPDLYGNMTTTQKNMSSGAAKKLRVKRGGTTYYLYDDTAQ